MIRAISFDLWDTIVVDDSDELERAALGLLSKHDERRALLHAAVPHRELSDVVAACDEVDTAFRYAWKVEHTNWTVDARLRRVFERLGEQPSEAAFQAAVEGWETMELLHSPRLIDGAAPAIAALASRYPLAICSDAIVSPGARPAAAARKARGQSTSQASPSPTRSGAPSRIARCLTQRLPGSVFRWRPWSTSVIVTARHRRPSSARDEGDPVHRLARRRQGRSLGGRRARLTLIFLA